MSGSASRFRESVRGLGDTDGIHLSLLTHILVFEYSYFHIFLFSHILIWIYG
jgi:hypothetical protein